ncbi:hypothetical protein [Xanthomonas arboricola]|uniref:hypothetical protein n=1 Tax=Xanthomonas arboricola TaxID=56448 RepID=UPI0011B050CC|nr:hypothetical protein [Xanthomonas arboricola]MBB6574824.1 hypothetical protein [Xanthomonas arboricola]
MKFIISLLILSILAGCSESKNSVSLPDGFKIWVMNSKEVYLANAGDELLVGPYLKNIGLTKNYIVTTSLKADSNYTGKIETSGYSLIERKSGRVFTHLSEIEVKKTLAEKGEYFPKLLEYRNYELVVN